MLGLTMLFCLPLWLATGCELLELGEGAEAAAGAETAAAAEAAGGAEVATGAGDLAELGSRSGAAEVSGRVGSGDSLGTSPRGAAASPPMFRDAFSAEPYDTDVLHEDLGGNKVSSTKIRNGRGIHFDKYDRKDGYSVRYQGGSQGYDNANNRVAYTRVKGNVSTGYDLNHKMTGYSERIGNKAYTYDAMGRRTGVSILRPVGSMPTTQVPLIPPPLSRCRTGYHVIESGGNFYCAPNAMHTYTPPS
jgi:YD repeat-containing protein